MVNSDVQLLRNKLEQFKGKKEQLENSLQKAQKELEETKQAIRNHEQALEIVKEVGLKTQQSLQFHIAGIVTMALDSVFEDPYEMQVEFVQRRGKTECDLFFKKGEDIINPLSASGGGAVDVASFALRVASWSMQLPKTRNTLLLDEPFKNLSEELLPKAGEMLKRISQQLGIQIIMVTHSDTLIESADRVFKVRNADRKSTITIE